MVGPVNLEAKIGWSFPRGAVFAPVAISMYTVTLCFSNFYVAEIVSTHLWYIKLIIAATLDMVSIIKKIKVRLYSTLWKTYWKFKINFNYNLLTFFLLRKAKIEKKGLLLVLKFKNYHDWKHMYMLIL